MSLPHYPCTFSFPLSHTKPLPLNPILSPHLHTRGLGPLIKDTEERVLVSLQSKCDTDDSTFIHYPQVFDCLKEYESFFTSPFSLSCSEGGKEHVLVCPFSFWACSVPPGFSDLSTISGLYLFSTRFFLISEKKPRV